MKTVIYGFILVLFLLAGYHLYTYYGEDILVPTPLVGQEVSDKQVDVELADNDGSTSTTDSNGSQDQTINDIPLGFGPDDSLKEKEELVIANNQPVTFSGKIQEVNIGCFYDAECYIIIDGKRLTVMRGWSQGELGHVRGVENFSVLETYVGETAKVFAGKNVDGSYTLYGNSKYYLEVEPKHGVLLGLHDQGVGELDIYLEEVIEDSRCPSDVSCIQAGTVRVRGRVVSGGQTIARTFVLNEPIVTLGKTIELVSVTPATNTKINLKEEDYRFLFKFRD